MDTRLICARFLPEERETHISFDPEQNLWILESNIARHYNKAMRAGWEPISQWVYDDGTICGMTLCAHERAITIKTPNKRTLSAEHKEKLTSSQIDDLEAILED